MLRELTIKVDAHDMGREGVAARLIARITARHRWCLSGSPVGNDLGVIYWQMVCLHLTSEWPTYEVFTTEVINRAERERKHNSSI